MPRLVPLHVRDGGWRLDLDALRAAAGPRTRAVFLMNPSFPTGAVLSAAEWEAVAELCREHDLWLLYWSLMEGIVFDGAPVRHPAALDGMAERTITIGSVSMEWRMIGWRIGWLAGPPAIAPDLAVVHIYNGLTPGRHRAGRRAGGAGRARGLPARLRRRVAAPARRRARPSSTATRWSAPTAAGRCWSTRARWGSTPRRRPSVCSRSASPPRRWAAGAARSLPATCGSCSPTSRSSGSPLLGERFRAALGRRRRL